MIEYQTLTAAHVVQVRRERLQALEADHARTVLLLAEEPDNAELREQLAELERRITVHALTESPRTVESRPAEPEASDLAVTNGHRSP